MAFNLLTDPFIEVEIPEARLMDLPSLFAAWASGQQVSLAGLRAHQRPAVHMCLVQLAVAATRGSRDGGKAAVSREEWLARLQRVAPIEAWELVGERSDVAAFLQPPMSEEDVAKFWGTPAADDLTTLVASKNHAVKQAKMGESSPWAWAAALIELQTMSGFSGRGNYGIVRMNGGFGSRPLVSMYSDMADGARWLRDVTVLLDRIPEVEKACPALEGGDHERVAALWTLPWDGATQVRLDELDPVFIEVCRRVRLTFEHGRIKAKVGNSKAARISADPALKGRLGDPWVPIDTGEGKSFTPGDDGWTYDRLRKLIIGGSDVSLQRSILQRPAATETGDMYFHAAVLVGGQGKTGGYHERTIPIPGSAVFDLFSGQGTELTVAKAAEQMVADAAKAWKAVRRALLCYAQGGAKEINYGRKESAAAVDPYRTVFDAAVSDIYFRCLWETYQGQQRAEGWLEPLRETGRKVVDAGIAALPVRSEFSFRATAMAKKTFESDMRYAFEELR